jgi:hypothetical protein
MRGNVERPRPAARKLRFDFVRTELGKADFRTVVAQIGRDAVQLAVIAQPNRVVASQPRAAADDRVQRMTVVAHQIFFQFFTLRSILRLDLC